MKVVKKDVTNVKEIARALREGKLICAPTDTLYGILGNALDKKAVEEVYRIKGRDPQKPLIVLFESVEQLTEHGVVIPERFKDKLKKLIPAPITFVLPLDSESPFRALFCRDNLAVRIPDDNFLRALIKETFPLFAPSANPQGEKPATNCKECYRYFRDKLAYCVEGKPGNVPSTIVSLLGNTPELIREGAIKFSKVMEVLVGEEA
ncbi:L-threonylcarbamoyladenylate synthase [Phorcysia thermohydrogeniphila]|uniref:L-threonylcarbamoyladenylate synthase n=1 Tax=Phorcysia thermohydrogeniphila TaxID=936138 RepID=A0A4R1GA54_9BACT|nr:L-threonylcarbamoyladenylate synthase [Phorcysia thermohydrogeniphila]TCK04578.1 L-threonylcarbamoyladenylate synthase [Phorcysia thermohydrogeniphila]